VADRSRNASRSHMKPAAEPQCASRGPRCPETGTRAVTGPRHRCPTMTSPFTLHLSSAAYHGWILIHLDRSSIVARTHHHRRRKFMAIVTAAVLGGVCCTDR
jgi:hypothetical protein